MFVAGIYAGFLGFLLLGVYNRYDKVRAAIIDEVNGLTTLDRLAVALPAATTATLRGGLKQYAQDVVTVEWPQLRDRNADPIVGRAAIRAGVRRYGQYSFEKGRRTLRAGTV